jgi:hypothetical protein
MAIKISGFQVGNTEIKLQDTDGMTLTQICEALKVRFEGSSFIVNGKRLSAAEAPSAKIGDGDDVRIAPKGDGGC